MVYLSKDDMFEAHKSSLIADYDRITVINLYQPLIGYAALSLYFTLISEASNQKITPISSHENLLLRMKMSSGEFLEARKSLEGVGLLKTFLTNEGGIKFYRYEIFAPKTPDQFFADVLLFGTLVKYVGHAEANRLKAIYKSKEIISQGEDVSASFIDVYHPENLDDSLLPSLEKNKDLKGRKRAKIDTEFSYEKFFDFIKKNSQFNEGTFDKKDMKEIERIATLYGVTEEETAAVVLSYFNPLSENKVDLENVDKMLRDQCNFYKFTKRNDPTQKLSNINSEAILGQKIKLMEKYAPGKFLSFLQNGTMPASSDLKIIDSLSKNFRLTNPVINVVVDFVLQKNNNLLSRAYAEKIAASLAREGIETAVDAMNYLVSANKNKKKTKPQYNNNYNNKGYSPTPNLDNSGESEELTEEEIAEWDQMVNEIERGDNDGKAEY